MNKIAILKLILLRGRDENKESDKQDDGSEEMLYKKTSKILKETKGW